MEVFWNQEYPFLSYLLRGQIKATQTEWAKQGTSWNQTKICYMLPADISKICVEKNNFCSIKVSIKIPYRFGLFWFWFWFLICLEKITWNTWFPFETTLKCTWNGFPFWKEEFWEYFSNTFCCLFNVFFVLSFIKSIYNRSSWCSVLMKEFCSSVNNVQDAVKWVI